MEKKEEYLTRNIERSRWWISKAKDTLAEAKLLLPSGQTRLGAVNRLYYSSHHAAKALLQLIGINPRSHSAIISQFSYEWIKKRGFPASYGKLLKDLEIDRKRSDYGEYVSTYQKEIESIYRRVNIFVEKVGRVIPPITIAKILEIIVNENPEIRDFSFDIYCPKSYYHHTRLTIWCPKGRCTQKWLNTLLNSSIKTLNNLHVKQSYAYVIGLNSRINQYEPMHLLMLDFDDISTIPRDRFKKEPGFIFRTGSGFHFIGARLYHYREWKSHMKSFLPLASKQHFDLSMKRGYATLRLTASIKKPIAPIYIGRSS
jgi:uncharacterized protein (UPF0332 family)